ncbi:hypothetical protein D3C76_588700 [compost metagenome]
MGIAALNPSYVSASRSYKKHSGWRGNRGGFHPPYARSDDVGRVKPAANQAGRSTRKCARNTVSTIFQRPSMQR